MQSRLLIRKSHDQGPCHLAPSGTDDVIIEVSDNGCGMDKETLIGSLKPFFTTKPLATGTGSGSMSVKM